MEFDNQENLFSLKKIKMIVGMAFIPLITLAGFEVVPIDMFYTIPALVLLYVAFLFYWQKREYSYVKFSDSGDYIIFRYFEMYGIFRKSVGKMVKIPKTQLLKFDLDEKANSEKLILHQKAKDGTHVYPYISISAFTKKQINEVRSSLNQYAQEQ